VLQPDHATTPAEALLRHDHRAQRGGTSSHDINADTAIALCAVAAIGVLLVLAPPGQLSLAGQEHGRTIPLAVVEEKSRSAADELCWVLSCRLAGPTKILVHRALAYALNHVMPDKMAPSW